MRPLLIALVLLGCVDASQQFPGATNACETREGPLVGCGPEIGPGPEDQIRDACRKLASCGLVSIQTMGDLRTFERCVNDFENYAIDVLPGILDCVGRSTCEQLRDPNSDTVSICERYGR